MTKASKDFLTIDAAARELYQNQFDNLMVFQIMVEDTNAKKGYSYFGKIIVRIGKGATHQCFMQIFGFPIQESKQRDFYAINVLKDLVASYELASHEYTSKEEIELAQKFKDYFANGFQSNMNWSDFRLLLNTETEFNILQVI